MEEKAYYSVLSAPEADKTFERAASAIMGKALQRVINLRDNMMPQEDLYNSIIFDIRIAGFRNTKHETKTWCEIKTYEAPINLD